MYTQCLIASRAHIRNQWCQCHIFIVERVGRVNSNMIGGAIAQNKEDVLHMSYIHVNMLCYVFVPFV